MMTTSMSTQSENYRLIEQAIQFIENNFKYQPSLDEIAASVNLSKFHFQRLFKTWAGVSPTQFLHYLTLEYAKSRLRESRTVLEATMESGLSSPGRLHDMFVSFEAMTPGEYKKSGEGLEVQFGFHPTQFGECLVAITPRGICALRFVNDGDRIGIINGLKSELPQAVFVENRGNTKGVIHRIFSDTNLGEAEGFHLYIKGTNFQIQVWQALLALPYGSMVTYGDIANRIATPSASRAVGNAVAKNPVAYLIPCHRVINKSGASNQYRWGSARKKAILGWEAVRIHKPEL